MNGYRLYLVSLVLASWTLSARAGDINLGTGTTNAQNSARVNFTMGNGKKIVAMNFLVELKIGTTTINPADCVQGFENGGESGYVIAPINLVAGKHNVKIKVNLQGGGTAVDEREVTFAKSSNE